MADTADQDWLALIRFTGEDRVAFLQGQLTQDVARLDADCPALLAASCDPKGRVLAVLTLVCLPDALIVALRQELAAEWLAGVLRYKLRSKVQAELADDLRIVAADAGAITTQDVLAHWHFGTVHEALVTADSTLRSDTTQWREQRLENGIYDIPAQAVSGFTPHMLSLDQVDAISFTKGCYTGQEVVARTEHLGSVKRRARLFRTTTPIADREEHVAMNDARKAGRVVAAAGRLAAAVVSEADAGKTHSLPDGNALVPATLTDHEQ